MQGESSFVTERTKCSEAEWSERMNKAAVLRGIEALVCDRGSKAKNFMAAIEVL